MSVGSVLLPVPVLVGFQKLKWNSAPVRHLKPIVAAPLTDLLDVVRRFVGLPHTTTAQLRAEFANLKSTMASDLTKDNAAGWQTAPVSQKRELLDTIFSRIVVRKAGRGARWNPDRLECHFTPYGEEMYERFGQDELPDTSSWAALRGREPRRREGWVSDSQPHDPEDPWSSLNVT